MPVPGIVWSADRSMMSCRWGGVSYAVTRMAGQTDAQMMAVVREWFAEKSIRLPSFAEADAVAPPERHHE